MSLREKYRAASKLNAAALTVPEWGEVRVRELSAPELEEYQLSQLDFNKPGADGLPSRRAKIDFARLACWAVVDESGARVFAEDDLPWLRSEVSNRVLEPIGTRILELTGMGAKKNSETTPASSESTCSPGGSTNPTPTPSLPECAAASG